MSRSGLSYQVAELESTRGWITRERFADDERGVVARITTDGERMRQRVFAGHVDIVRTAFLDAVEPGELATLTAALERVVGRLRIGPHRRRRTVSSGSFPVGRRRGTRWRHH